MNLLWLIPIDQTKNGSNRNTRVSRYRLFRKQKCCIRLYFICMGSVNLCVAADHKSKALQVDVIQEPTICLTVQQDEHEVSQVRSARACCPVSLVD